MWEGAAMERAATGAEAAAEAMGAARAEATAEAVGRAELEASAASAVAVGRRGAGHARERTTDQH